MGFLAWIILGLIVGAIVKAVMPGRVGGGWVTSLVLGVVGAIVGGWIGGLLFGGGEWLLRPRHLASRHRRRPGRRRHLRRNHRPQQDATRALLEGTVSANLPTVRRATGSGPGPLLYVRRLLMTSFRRQQASVALGPWRWRRGTRWRPFRGSGFRRLRRRARPPGGRPVRVLPRRGPAPRCRTARRWALSSAYTDPAAACPSRRAAFSSWSWSRFSWP